MQKFCKGEANLGYFKKRGCSCKQHQGEHWKTMLKIYFGNFKGGGGEIDTRGGGHLPLNTPLRHGELLQVMLSQR